MEFVLAAAIALTGPSTGSADLVHPAPLTLRDHSTFKAIPQVWQLPDNRPDAVASATHWG